MAVYEVSLFKSEKTLYLGKTSSTAELRAFIKNIGKKSIYIKRIPDTKKGKANRCDLQKLF